MKYKKQIRLFVAVPLPSSICDELARLQIELKKSELCEGRYTDAAQAHFTLVFIGSVNANELDAIKQALGTLSFPALMAQVGHVNFFQKRGEIGVIYLSITCPELTKLAHLVAEALSPWVVPEERPFDGHVTLIRVNRVQKGEKLIAFLHHLAVKPSAFPLDYFVLFASELGPEGPQYQELSRYPLVGPRSTI